MNKIFFYYLSIFLFPSFLFAQAPTSGLLTYWSFEDGQGSTAVDFSGNGNTIALLNNMGQNATPKTGMIPIFNPGKRGRGLLNEGFQGTGDNFNVEGHSFGSVTMTNWNTTGNSTVTFWIYPWSGYSNDNTRQIIISSIGSGDYYEIRMLKQNHALCLTNGTGFACSPDNSVLSDTWTFIAFTRDSSGNTTVTVNSTKTTGLFAGTSVSNSSLGIMSRPGGGGSDPFIGVIDEMRIYNRILNDTEITDTFNDDPNSGAVTISSIGVSANVFTWTTSGNADSQVCYGLTQETTQCTDVSQTGGVTSHSVDLSSNIFPNALYYYYIISKGTSDNKVAVSSLQTFTSPASGDPCQIAGVTDSPCAPDSGGTTRIVPDNFSTIDAAFAAASPGDTIQVKDGTYTTTFNKNDGSLAHPYTLQAFPGNHPLLSSIIINQPWLIVDGFKTDTVSIFGPDTTLGTNGKNLTFRNEIFNGAEQGIISQNGQDVLVEKSTFLDNGFADLGGQNCDQHFGPSGTNEAVTPFTWTHCHGMYLGGFVSCTSALGGGCASIDINKTTSQRWYIRQNHYIHPSGSDIQNRIDALFMGDHYLVENNIFEGYSDGFHWNDTHRSIIRNNTISGIGQNNFPNYTAGPWGDHVNSTVFANNVIYQPNPNNGAGVGSFQMIFQGNPVHRFDYISNYIAATADAVFGFTNDTCPTTCEYSKSQFASITGETGTVTTISNGATGADLGWTTGNFNIPNSSPLTGIGSYPCPAVDFNGSARNACDIGAFAAPSSTTNPPPVRSNPTPTGTLVAGTTSTTIGLTTDGSSDTCKYGSVPNISYASQPNSMTNKGTSHTASVSGLSAGTQTFYTRCQNSNGPNLNDFAIPVTIASSASAPILSNGSPSGTLPSQSGGVPISVTTNINAICKYGTTSGVSYPSIANTFSQTGGTIHSQSITVTPGINYNFFIRCANASDTSVFTTVDFPISFFVSTSPTTTTTLINVNSNLTLSQNLVIGSSQGSCNILSFGAFDLYLNPLSLTFNPISSWTDSTNLITYSQQNQQAQPQLDSINSLTAAKFLSTNFQSLISQSPVSLGGTFTLFIIIQPSDAVGVFDGALLTHGAISGLYWRGSGGNQNHVDMFNVTDQFNNSVITPNIPHLVVLESTSGSGTFYIDGNSDGSFTWPTSGVTMDSIGNEPNNDAYNGNIGPITVWGFVDATKRNAYSSCLRSQWGTP